MTILRLDLFLKASIFFILCFIGFCDAKPPQLTPRDARTKIEEILKAHVTYQSLNSDTIIKRALQNYIDEVDPSKTYFIETDLLTWLNPSDKLISQVLENYRKENFETFEQIHESLLKAIQRRRLLEQTIESSTLLKGVQASEFKDISWAKNEKELLERLVRIKSLQLDTAEKLNQETRPQFLQRLNKRRLNREEELITHSSQERSQLVLSFVLKAVSAALDSQTTYFTPAEANQFMIQVQQKLFGIGAQLRDDLNGFRIIRILEGGPASFGNKLKIGDRIIAVNQEPVVGMEITEAVELIRGPEGTNVNLTILREIEENGTKREEKCEIDLLRGEVVLKESRIEVSYEPCGDGIIAILHLFSFYQDNKSSSASDLLEAINSLKKEHRIDGIILDLRNNGGGLLPQAVYVAGLFIKKGVVVSVKDNTGIVQKLRNLENSKAWDGPLVILTNRASASASEIVAQSLQDYGRAVIVGDSETYGKGTFQTFSLETSNYGKVNPKGEFKVTRGRYYTVSGKSPQLVGVKADIIVPGLFAESEFGEKYSKFPLETDNIPPSFNDDLSDVPFIHRAQVMRLYRSDLQSICTLYKPHIEFLKENSKERISHNLNYQNFLKEIEKKDLSAEFIESFGQTDLQQKEAINIMKDLIYILQQEQSPSQAVGA